MPDLLIAILYVPGEGLLLLRGYSSILTLIYIYMTKG